jgi:cardiolipin synthase
LIIRLSIRLLAVAAILATAACISPEPDVNPVIDSASGAPPIVGSGGQKLSPGQSKAVVASLAQQDGGDVLQRHLALEKALGGSPLVVGNKTILLRDGEATFAAMFKAIAAAKHYVDLEYFTFEDVDSDGKKLGDLLIAKQRAGVQINVTYDAVGSSGTPPELFDRLRQAGVAILVFHPLDPLQAKAEYSVNDRDHRKILVADGTVGIVGGVNLSNVYGSKIFSKDRPAAAQTQPGEWRDTDLVIEGPAVAQLEHLFLDTWTRQKGPPLVPAGYLPPLTAKGDEALHIIGSSPDEIVPQYYATILSAMRNAEKSIWISAAYFVPTDQEQEDLLAAAGRGVDVRILVPSKSDSQFALMVGHSRYDRLLRAGIKIYELRNKTLHSKTATIDGVWSVIGSSNFDHRSVLFNNEVDAVVLGRSTAEQFQAMFEDDFAHADQIDREAWENRPFEQRTEEYLARLIEVLL